jgi:hypothetical protein
MSAATFAILKVSGVDERARRCRRHQPHHLSDPDRASVPGALASLGIAARNWQVHGLLGYEISISA